MKTLFLISFLFFGSVLFAQDMNVMLRDAERLENVPDEKAAFHRFKEVLRMQPANVYVLSKCSELCSRIGNREPASTVRITYYEAAQKYAAIGLKVEPANSAANCMMAIALGRVSLEKSGKEKVKAAKQ